MMNLPMAIVMGSAFIAVGLFFGLKTVSDALYALWKLLHDLRINVNHYNKSERDWRAV